MAMKFCEACSSETEMSVFECGKCGGSSFVHKREDVKGITQPASTPKPTSTSKAQTTPPPVPAAVSTPSQKIQVDRINELIVEQRKTTHAVRAIAIYLLYQFITMVATGFILGIESANPDYSGDGYIITAGLALIGGTVTSIFAALSELSKSE